MKSIFITGGSGAFGHAFTNRLLKDDLASRIVIYSRDEFKQARMAAKFNNDERLRFEIGDVRDGPRLQDRMMGCDTVIHAAALKRIEGGNRHWQEFKKTNIDGSENVINAARVCGVERAIMLSTDKAFQPISFYGASKLSAEFMFLSANESYGAHGPKFSATRYGNVFRSTGSVVPMWEEAIENGADIVKISDPEVTRFFMHMNEAVQLVLNTIETMPREPVIPNLPAYRLGDLAEAMQVKTVKVGLGKFEKLHESMDEKRCSANARRMSVDELRAML